jgi:DNA-binding HxlR family transcriptional regulator
MSPPTNSFKPLAEPTPGELQYCPVFQHVMELLGRRWTGVILRALLNGEARFSDLKRAIPGLSDRLLSERLDELQSEGLLNRTFTDDVALYSLTERGEGLREPLTAIALHAEQWSGECHMADKPGRRS